MCTPARPTEKTNPRSARGTWQSALEHARRTSAAYLIAVCPQLTCRHLSGPPTRASSLAFDLAVLPLGGVTVNVDGPGQATLEATGLNPATWAAIHDVALPYGQYFVQGEGDSDDHYSVNAGPVLSDGWQGGFEKRQAEDVLRVHPDRTGDLSLYRVDVDLVARVLPVLAVGGSQPDAMCSRCSVAFWRHGRPGDSVACGEFTQACRNCRDADSTSIRAHYDQGRPHAESPASVLAPWQAELAQAAIHPFLEEFHGWDLRGLVQSAVELFGEAGDPNDVLSESQKHALDRAAALLDELSRSD
ncbi:hypothetical protein [Streptacidiphilus sp. EB103A]|uniref:hypothetical protein n=1 Tax=Streptacidiphilus sp. EB103A TaxID=3156275 RepID=UPI003514EDCC